jgi:hypothetical protein
MWRNTAKEESEELLKKAIEFTGNAELYGSWMMKVVSSWKYSCEHNMSYRGMNRQAWVGHAATCMAIKCPEHITRLAWHHLTQEQQDEANAKADEAILYWENHIHTLTEVQSEKRARRKRIRSREKAHNMDVQ